MIANSTVNNANYKMFLTFKNELKFKNYFIIKIFLIINFLGQNRLNSVE